MLIFSLGHFACSESRRPDYRFEILHSHHTGIDFKNQIAIDDDFNVLDFDYIYNGAGVAVGDFNQDGLPDVYFVGNIVSSRLYINQGGFRFRDVTSSAKVGTTSWAEGVTVTDINQDGLLDIYVSVSNRSDDDQNPNLLFVNQGLDSAGIPVFAEMASQYGIADVGYNTQAAFFDYDGDGDLDLYVLSNAMESFQRNLSRPKEITGKGKSNDKLYRNNGDGTFTNVSKDAGIVIEGYGLGLAVTDINLDGMPDIYVANDFLTNDILYINNGDGTFSNRIGEMIKHQSFNSMGVDVADFNNDGLSDILVVDMLPPDNLRQKTMFAPTENYDLYQANLGKGYEPQYVRNTLQLNRGNGKFSEIGFLAGIYQTDWSWSPLFADLDNDGRRDIFISNGYGKDVTDLDYINFSRSLGPFSTPEQRRKQLLEGLERLKEVRLPNFVFQNKGGLVFEDKGKDWGIIHPSISNGATYADFDGDGDLDLMVNNLNEGVYLYKNRSREKEPTNSNFLRVRLKGPNGNRQGVGTKLYVKLDDTDSSGVIFYEHFPTKGYKSYSEPVAHFGLGSKRKVHRLKAVWPDGRQEVLEGIAANQTLEINHKDATGDTASVESETVPLFKEVSQQLGIFYRHAHPVFKDFNRQRLLPHKHSENGPGIAVGDINRDGLEDFFVGGAQGSPGAVFIQQPNGRFTQKPLEPQSRFDDMGAIFFDADGDGFLDLYVVSGGSRHPESDTLYQDRLYFNDGKGNFIYRSEALPEMNFSGSVVAAADYDGDGDLDLFVGGRVRPGKYPYPPKSTILRNNNGRFEDVSRELFAGMAEIGMVTAALWSDFDEDGLIDLLAVGEWMPVTFLRQRRDPDGKVAFEDVTAQLGPLGSNGWWNSILASDWNGDGKLEYLMGNLGKNSRWQQPEGQPLVMVAKDFDGNKSPDPILFQYLQDGMYPVPGRDALVSQIPSWKNRFLAYSVYAQARLENIFPAEFAKDTTLFLADFLQSALMQKNLKGKFELLALPVEAQFAPQYGIQALQNGSGNSQQILMVGNFHGNETVTGRYDASFGTHLDANNAKMEARTLSVSGFIVEGEGRALASLICEDGATLLLASQHADSLKVFRQANSPKVVAAIKLGALDFKVIIELEDGKKFAKEFGYGHGYLSQESRILQIYPNYLKATVWDYAGKSRLIWERPSLVD